MKPFRLLLIALPIVLAIIGLRAAILSWPQPTSTSEDAVVTRTEEQTPVLQKKVEGGTIEGEVKEGIKGKLSSIAKTLDEIKKEKPVCAMMLSNYIGASLDGFTQPPSKRQPFDEKREEFALNYLDYGCSAGGLIWARVEVREIERKVVEAIRRSAQRAHN